MATSSTTAAAVAVSDHGLGGVHGEAPGVWPEHFLHGRDFDRVAQGGGRGVGIHVAHLLGTHAGVGKGIRHGSNLATLVGLGEAATVRRGREAKDLRVDAGAPGSGALERLDHDRRRALGRHEAFAPGIERPAGPCRIGAKDLYERARGSSKPEGTQDRIVAARRDRTRRPDRGAGGRGISRGFRGARPPTVLSAPSSTVRDHESKSPARPRLKGVVYRLPRT